MSIIRVSVGGGGAIFFHADRPHPFQKNNKKQTYKQKKKGWKH